jgi:hypothetical protein
MALLDRAIQSPCHAGQLQVRKKIWIPICAEMTITTNPLSFHALH